MKKLSCLLILFLPFMVWNRSTSSTKTLVTKSGIIKFSGYTWQTRETGPDTEGPGHNRWKGSNGFVDTKGYLHLKLSKVKGEWYCAEVSSTRKFGYGTYQWQIEGRTDTMDKNVVLGLFNYSGADGNDEMDIELTRWGIPLNRNTHYTIFTPQPLPPKESWSKNLKITLTGEGNTTQRLTRNTNNSVFFQQLSGFHDDNTNLVDSATCYNPPHTISSLAMPVYMNLWLYNSTSPANDLPIEIVIRSFKFTAQKQPVANAH